MPLHSFPIETKWTFRNCCTRFSFLHTSVLLSLHLPVSHSSLALRSHVLWIRTVVHGEPWILSEKFSFLISAASFTLNLLPRAKRQHGIYETCARRRKCDYSLSISLSILFSPYPRQRGNGEDVLTPQTGALLLSLIFLTPVFTPPFKPFSSILPPHSSCFALSALLLPLQRLSFSAISISLPRAQRQFSRSSPEPFSSPFPLSLTFSHTRLTLRLIFTNSAGISGQYDQILAG